MKTIVAGWFSFEQMGATAGDLLCAELTSRWLEKGGHQYDVAYAPPFEGGVHWRDVDPAEYRLLVFVCGPFGENELIHEFLNRFHHCAKIGLNLSMLQPLSEFNPFDSLFERDSELVSRPDISFGNTPAGVPVAGVLLVHPQEEYGKRSLHAEANAAIDRLLASREIAAIQIDTRLDCNAERLRTPAEIESLIRATDVVITTRLHGMVTAIKNGIAPVVIDPIAGGAKVLRQAEAIGWPVVHTADKLDDEELRASLAYCLTEKARARARQCAEAARLAVHGIRDQFIRAAASLNGEGSD